MTPTEFACLAVDIGGTTTRAALVEGGRLTRRLEAPTPASAGPGRVLGQVLALLGGLDAPAQVPLAVACTGRVHQGHVTAVNQGTMPGWTAVPVQATLERDTGRSVTVINDAKAATVAEWHAAGTPGNFMFVTVSTGIGSGLVVQGRLLNAADGQDVGLGFTRGQGGQPLEATVSGRGLEAVAAEAGGVRALFDAAERGDAAAQALLSGPLHLLADRVHDAHCLLGLDAVTLGGSVGLRNWTHAVLQGALPALPLHRAAHGPDAGLLGAALYAAQEQTT